MMRFNSASNEWTSITDLFANAMAQTGDGVVVLSTEGPVLQDSSSTWREISRGNRDHVAALHAVTASDAWMAGEDRISHAGRVRHWNGTDWTLQQLPPNTGRRTSIWIRPSNVEGYAGGDQVVHWVNGSWQVEPFAQNTSAIFGNNGGQYIWFLGAGATAFDIIGNTTFSPPSAAGYSLAAGTVSSHVWAVGANGVTIRWDGQTWTPVTSNTSVNLRGIWGGGSDTWAVGGRQIV
ncbi:MAG TPA: hypothetical protein VIY56_16025, partial [Vicinamibacterales bacterium]